MSKEIYAPVGGIAQKITKVYAPVNGVARSMKKVYKGVNGVAQLVFEVKKKLSELVAGESIFLNVNGKPVEFLVVNRGIPSGSALYDSSCDGIWLLMKDVFIRTTMWNTTANNDYQNSNVHSYLNTTFLNLLDADVQSVIKQVKIPYHKGTGANGSVASGANGLSTKVFLLSGYELGFTKELDVYFPVDGATLEYFYSGTNAPRIAKFYDENASWWLRSPNVYNNSGVFYVSTYGGFNTQLSPSVYSGVGIRPAFILPYDADL